MKKGLVAIVFLLLSVSLSKAQNYATDSGSIMISGMANFMYLSGDLYDNSQGDGSTMITLAPNLMYFIIPNLAIGGTISFLNISQGDNSLSQIGIGPTVSYYIGGPDKNTIPYLSAGFRYNSMTGDVDENSGTTIIFAGGVVILVKKSIGIILEASFNLNNRSFDGGSESGSTISIGVGLSGFIY